MTFNAMSKSALYELTAKLLADCSDGRFSGKVETVWDAFSQSVVVWVDGRVDERPLKSTYLVSAETMFKGYPSEFVAQLATDVRELVLCPSCAG